MRKGKVSNNLGKYFSDIIYLTRDEGRSQYNNERDGCGWQHINRKTDHRRLDEITKKD